MLACEPIAGCGVLEFSPDGEGWWKAKSEVVDEDGMPHWWHISRSPSGQFYVVASPGLLERDPGSFPSFAKAVAWCQAREADLVRDRQASKPQPASEPAVGGELKFVCVGKGRWCSQLFDFGQYQVVVGDDGHFQPSIESIKVVELADPMPTFADAVGWCMRWHADYRRRQSCLQWKRFPDGSWRAAGTWGLRIAVNDVGKFAVYEDGVLVSEENTLEYAKAWCQELVNGKRH